MRWLDRLMGLASTLVLVRLLAPADFGVVAMAAIVVGLIDVVLDLGVHVALIQNRNATDEHFHTGWTIRLLQATLAALIVLAGAWPIADYYHDARVIAVMQVMALTVFIGGLENIGVVMFQKHMEFGRDFRFFFLKRLAGVVISISAAITLHSYWALVIGSLGARVAGVVLSYVLHDFRPRFSLAKTREIWSLSQWVLLKNIASYVEARLDKLVVGRRSDATTMGAYTLADEIAALPSTELLAPLGRVLFPAFVEARASPSNLRRIFLLALGIQMLVGLPAAIGISLVAKEVVLAVLGPSWAMAIPFVQVMGLVNALSTFIGCTGYVLLALGRVKTVSYCVFMQVGLFVLLLAGFASSDAYHVVLMRLAVAFAGAIAFAWVTLRALPDVAWSDLLATCWRPLVATATMAAVLLITPLPNDLVPIMALAVKIALGATTYVLITFGLWLASGRPDGAERYAQEKLLHFKARFV